MCPPKIYMFSNKIARISLVAQMVKESVCNTGALGSIPESESSPGEGNGYPLQYFCLENSIDRGAHSPWVCKKSDTTERLTHAHIRDPRRSLSLPTMCGLRRKTAICEPGLGGLSDIRSASALVLSFSAPRTMRSKFVISTHFHSIYSILL